VPSRPPQEPSGHPKSPSATQKEREPSWYQRDPQEDNPDSDKKKKKEGSRHLFSSIVYTKNKSKITNQLAKATARSEDPSSGMRDPQAHGEEQQAQSLPVFEPNSINFRSNQNPSSTAEEDTCTHYKKLGHGKDRCGFLLYDLRPKR
jgi:hypothetical protein